MPATHPTHFEKKQRQDRIALKNPAPNPRRSALLDLERAGGKSPVGPARDRSAISTQPQRRALVRASRLEGEFQTYGRMSILR